MQQASIAAGIVGGFVSFLAGQGVDAEALAGKAGIDLNLLADPDARLAFEHYARLIRLAQDATGDTGLSLRFGAAVGMADMSILGLIMEASATMGEAFAQMQSFGRLALAPDPKLPPRFALEQQGGRLFLIERRPDADAFPELTEEAFAQLTCGPRRFLDRPHVIGVHLSFGAPAHAALYETIFACPIHFDAGFSGLELHPDVAEWPVARERRYVFGVLCEKADNLLMRAARPVAGVRAQLEEAMRADMHWGEPNADVLARQLGFSRSTLFRRLRDEGTSFVLVLDALRHEMAMQYLKGGRLSIEEIAYLLGFSEAAAFSRAFLRWEGVSPGQYRRRNAGGGQKPAI